MVSAPPQAAGADAVPQIAGSGRRRG
jgi:hypothetical protein